MSGDLRAFFGATKAPKRKLETSVFAVSDKSAKKDKNDSSFLKEDKDSSSNSWQLQLESMDSSWKSVLEPEFRKPYLCRLTTFLESEERGGKKIFPPKDCMFSAFSLCPFDDVKVVVIGQDPYHGPNQANGLAFSVTKGVSIPPSLRNIIKEAAEDSALSPRVKGSHGHGCLEKWAQQGVLMLNTCLTVRRGEANSHQKKGWEDFTDAVVAQLRKKEGLVYLLWGKPAQSKCSNINTSKNLSCFLHFIYIYKYI